MLWALAMPSVWALRYIDFCVWGVHVVSRIGMRVIYVVTSFRCARVVRSIGIEWKLDSEFHELAAEADDSVGCGGPVH